MLVFANMKDITIMGITILKFALKPTVVPRIGREDLDTIIPMDEYIDNDFDQPKKKSKKIGPTNPEGPFKMEILFKGLKYEVIIENKTYDQFKISILMVEETPED